jgi:hypothetical protein
MSNRSHGRSWAVVRNLAGALAIALLVTAPAFAETPFALVKGDWVGGGELNFKDGSKEKLSCKAYYTSSDDGNTLTTAYRCAGSSNKVELRCRLNHANGKVDGTWEERTFNASGDASGTLKTGSLRLNFRGGVAGSMTVSFSETSQTVSISISTTEVPLKRMQFSMKRG